MNINWYELSFLKGRDFVALSEKNQLLFLGSEEDFDDTIPVNAHLFSKLVS